MQFIKNGIHFKNIEEYKSGDFLNRFNFKQMNDYITSEGNELFIKKEQMFKDYLDENFTDHNNNDIWFAYQEFVLDDYELDELEHLDNYEYLTEFIKNMDEKKYYKEKKDLLFLNYNLDNQTIKRLLELTNKNKKFDTAFKMSVMYDSLCYAINSRLQK